MTDIRIDLHTLQRAEERGATSGEIEEVILTGMLMTAKSGRLRRGKTFRFDQERLGKYYEQKRIEVIYAVVDDTLVTVTAFVFTANGAVECR